MINFSSRATPDERSTERSEDGALLIDALAGETAAWAALVRRHDRYLTHVARTLVGRGGDDLVQSAWLRLLERGDSIRNPDAVRAWLVRVMQREAMTIHRRRAREQAMTLDGGLAESLASTEPTPETCVMREATADLVKDAMNELPPRQHTLLTFLASESAHYSEIAAKLSMPVGSIGPTRARALEHLGRALASRGVNCNLALAS